jgi:hypothetical protein
MYGTPKEDSMRGGAGSGRRGAPVSVPREADFSAEAISSRERSMSEKVSSGGVNHF